MWGIILEKVLGPFLGPLGNFVSKSCQEKCKEKLKGKMKSLQSQFKDPAKYSHLIEYLVHRYADYPILKRKGAKNNYESFPVAIFPLNNNLHCKLEPKYEQDLQEKGAIYSSKKYRTFKEQYDMKIGNINVEEEKKKFKNYSIYTMLDFNSESGILSCGRGRYEDMLDSCEELGYELLNILADGCTQPRKIDKRTKLRNKLHSLVSDPVRSGKERVGGLGISALLVYRKEVNLKILVMRRSSTTVGLHEGLMHVIPSGMFQTMGNVKGDFDDVNESVYREYAEELFNISHSDDTIIDIRTHNQYQESVQYLKKLKTEGKVRLETTGLAVDLLTLRPEICMLLHIDDPEWYDTHFHSTNENMQFKKNIEASSIDFNNFDYSSNDANLLEIINPKNTIPAGAAAFWLGIAKLRKKLS